MTTLIPHLTRPGSGLVFSRGTWWALYSVKTTEKRPRKPPVEVILRRRKSLSTDDLATARQRRDQWYADQRKAGAVDARRRGRPSHDERVVQNETSPSTGANGNDHE